MTNTRHVLQLVEDEDGAPYPEEIQQAIWAARFEAWHEGHQAGAADEFDAREGKDHDDTPNPYADTLAPTAEAEGDEPVPYVAIGTGERAPWEGLSLNCPDCGEGPLPLEDSDPPLLSFISHCGKSWVRGPFRPEALTEEAKPGNRDSHEWLGFNR